MSPIRTLTVFALLACTPAWADDPATTRDQTRDMDRDGDQDREKDAIHQKDMDQLRTHLEKKVKLSEQDLELIAPALRRYLRLNGEQAHVRTMIQAGVDAGCKGECLQEMVRSANRAMIWGMQDKQAAMVVNDCLQDRVQDRDRTGARWTDKDFGDQLHDRVQDRLQLWERDRDRMIDRERDRLLDRAHDREMDRAQDRASAGKGRGK